MKKTILLLYASLIGTSSFAQLEKGTWLVGGSGSFSSVTVKGIEPKSNEKTLILSPNLGLFILDKFALGSSSTVGFTKSNYYDNPSFPDRTSSNYLLGLFSKYYFLKSTNSVNIFSEVDYYIYNTNNNNNINFSLGPVLFLNSQTAFEFKINYSLGEKNSISNFFSAGLGLQIHLKKNGS